MRLKTMSLMQAWICESEKDQTEEG